MTHKFEPEYYAANDDRRLHDEAKAFYDVLWARAGALYSLHQWEGELAGHIKPSVDALEYELIRLITDHVGPGPRLSGARMDRTALAKRMREIAAALERDADDGWWREEVERRVIDKLQSLTSIRFLHAKSISDTSVVVFFTLPGSELICNSIVSMDLLLSDNDEDATVLEWLFRKQADEIKRKLEDQERDADD